MIDGNRCQKNAFLRLGMLAGRDMREPYWNVLYLDLVGSLMTVYMC